MRLARRDSVGFAARGVHLPSPAKPSKLIFAAEESPDDSTTTESSFWLRGKSISRYMPGSGGCQLLQRVTSLLSKASWISQGLGCAVRRHSGSRGRSRPLSNTRNSENDHCA